MNAPKSTLSNNAFCVLQVSAGLDEGGVERGTLEMARHIVAKGWRSLVVSEGGKLVDPLLRTGAEHIELPLIKRSPLNILINAVRLAGIISRNDVDIVHARSRAPAWSAYLACKITGTPFVTTFHGTYGLHNGFKKFYNSVMVKGSRVIAISKFIATHIQQNYGVHKTKIVTVPRGYDPLVFDPKKIKSEDVEALWEEWHIPARTPVILMPGRLTRWKGQSVFLKALSKMTNTYWKAILVGGHGSKDKFYWELKKQVENLGLTDRVIFHGSSDNMPLMYAAADVVVSNSLEPEAFGRVAVEAQAMGKPVVATGHGGSLETIKSGETGWLVKPNEPHKLALALTDAITTSPKKLKQIGKEAQNWVHAHFTIQKMCEGEFEVYLDILGFDANEKEELSA